jgi:eukaryotic-like serine/threonine-protein kinase
MWTPDGTHVVYQERPQSGSAIWWTRADGGSEPQLFFKSPTNGTVPMSFSPDGRQLLYFTIRPDIDIYVLPLDLSDPDRPKPGAPVTFLKTRFAESEPMFSPDGKWVAYMSDEAGRTEVYVRPYPGPGVHVSSAGGASPRWSRTRQELFFVGADGCLWMAPYTVKGRDLQAPSGHDAGAMS